MSHADAGLLARDLTDQRALLADRQVSSVELATQTLAAVAASAGAVNAYLSVDADAVLAAAVGGRGPGPLVTALAKEGAGFWGRRLPVTVVPGDLSDEEIEELA